MKNWKKEFYKAWQEAVDFDTGETSIDDIEQFIQHTIEEHDRELVKRVEKFIEGELYLFPFGMEPIAIDEQGIRYKGMAINPDDIITMIKGEE